MSRGRNGGAGGAKGARRATAVLNVSSGRSKSNCCGPGTSSAYRNWCGPWKSFALSTTSTG